MNKYQMEVRGLRGVGAGFSAPSINDAFGEAKERAFRILLEMATSRDSIRASDHLQCALYILDPENSEPSLLVEFVVDIELSFQISKVGF